MFDPKGADTVNNTMRLVFRVPRQPTRPLMVLKQHLILSCVKLVQIPGILPALPSTASQFECLAISRSLPSGSYDAFALSRPSKDDLLVYS